MKRIMFILMLSTLILLSSCNTKPSYNNIKGDDKIKLKFCEGNTPEDCLRSWLKLNTNFSSNEVDTLFTIYLNSTFTEGKCPPGYEQVGLEDSGDSYKLVCRTNNFEMHNTIQKSDLNRTYYSLTYSVRLGEYNYCDTTTHCGALVSEKDGEFQFDTYGGPLENYPITIGLDQAIEIFENDARCKNSTDYPWESAPRLIDTDDVNLYGFNSWYHNNKIMYWSILSRGANCKVNTRTGALTVTYMGT